MTIKANTVDPKANRIEAAQAQQTAAFWRAMLEGIATEIYFEALRARQRNAPAVRKELRAYRFQYADRFGKPTKAEARAAHNAKLLFGPLSQFQR